MQRTLNAETAKYVGKKVKVAGWVQTIRSHGKIIFFDLRDKSGILQLVFSPKDESLYKTIHKIRPEWVIGAEGIIAERPKGMVNPKITTGKVELHPENLEIFSEAKTLPFPIDTDGYEINEEMRMKYRYLDLRRERMKKNLILRHKLVKFIRDFMGDKGFIEIETPLLTKTTPEGARDYIVPSRLYPGKFYALPQSPQQYKELLMVGGIEKYFQIARAIRDEDPRADRQPEHTQWDFEMSFVEQEDIMKVLEEGIIKLTKYLEPMTGKKLLAEPLPRINYHESMKKYGTDKPDIRPEPKDPNVLAFAWIINFPLLEWNKEENRWDPIHHMFVMPKAGYENLLDTDPGKVISTQFDLVCNGYEICSGSIRINQRKLQEKVMQIIGLDIKKAKQQFGHLLEALELGAPPHGGAAPGIDRLAMLYAGESNIREVTAFSKTGDARDLMMNSPSEADSKQLKELHIEVKKKK
ncbi:MAG: aspartate--tRNA ligase [Candidatus Pacebacteria bacterium]|nr:aspartate--tRNA ligase [Candidatus Paceibacterota bacterium]